MTPTEIRAQSATGGAKFEKLEMLRGFAALYVFAGHYVLYRNLIPSGPLNWPLRFGQEAVMLFFLISGFVIHHSALRRPCGFREYFARRFLRIYPVFLVSLAVSLLLPADPGGLPAGEMAKRTAGNLLMLQDFAGGKPGVWFGALGGNAALWSLSYEWWFYLLFFPVFHFLRPERRVHAAGAVSLLGLGIQAAWPNQIALFALYFIIWWNGAEMARTISDGRRPTLRSQGWPLAYLVLAAAGTAAPAVLAAARGDALSPGLHPVLEARHFLSALAMVLGALAWSRLAFRGFDPVFRWFLWAAPFSYGIYALHYPLAVSARYLDAAVPGAAELAIYPVVALAAAWLAEGPIQRRINRLLPALAGIRKRE